VAAVVALAAVPRTAEAQLDPATLDTVQATPKGTIGLGLVGAELGLIIPSVSGLNEAWALSVFPVVGAAGGALAGYFALDKPGRNKGSVAALVVGLAGVLPAILVTVKGVRERAAGPMGADPSDRPAHRKAAACVPDGRGRTRAASTVAFRFARGRTRDDVL